MEPFQAVELGQQALWTALVLSAPALLVALLLSTGMGLLQTMTQVQDPTIALVPKVVGVAAVVVFCLPWIVERLVTYSHELISQVPHLVGGG